MNIHAFIFTYEVDRELVRHAANRLLDAGMSVTCVWDTAVPECATRAIPRGTHRPSTFPRKGNLNGIACLMGMYDLFCSVPREADWVVKVDADTLIRNAFVRRLAGSQNDAEGAYHMHTQERWWGAAYALRPETCKKAKAFAEKAILLGGVPEDRTTGEILDRMEAKKSSAPGGWIHYGAKEWWENPDADVLHFGDVRNIPAPYFYVRQRKEYIGRRMRDFMYADPDMIPLA